MKFKKLLFMVAMFTLSFSGHAQKSKGSPTIFGKTVELNDIESSRGVIKCASYEYEQYLRQKYPSMGSTDQFENWLSGRIAAYKQKEVNTSNLSITTSSTNNIITIPVVVHILHNNKPYGIGENITDEQVLSQIAVLNQDYRRLFGTPGYNDNEVGADIEIEFCLAARTPNNEESNGINRINIVPPPGGYTVDNVDSIKPSTQWDPNSYLNIWVVDRILMTFMGMPLGEVLGYSQFPVASGLLGLDYPEMPLAAHTDGVVIGHRHFGSYAIYPEGTYVSTNTRGRTATHEIGHFFGLRHIWGDTNNCSSDDFCADTPNATSALQECILRASCGVEEMKENYMNYTPDPCMNIFTEDQKYRIRTVLENSPRRNTLSSSLACVPLNTYGFDGRVNIVDLGGLCDTEIEPVISLKNVGETTDIASVEISYGVGENLQTYNWTGLITPGNLEEVTLPGIIFPIGVSDFFVSLVNINGTTDDNTNNNVMTRNIFKANSYTSTNVTLTLVTDEYGDETFWTLRDESNNTVAQGGQGGVYGSHQTIQQSFNLTPGCYTFTIYDMFSDGICCNEGNGSYTLAAEGEVIKTGGSFEFSESTTFKIGSASVDNYNVLEGILLYPNPTKDVLNIRTTTDIIPEEYIIYNTIGQVIRKAKITDTSALSIDTSGFANGVYLIKLTKEGKSKTMRFVKQ